MEGKDMPKKPKIPCSHKGCPTLIESGTGGKCEQHRKVEMKRYNDTRTDKQILRQYKTSRWQRVRKTALFRDGGWCQRCKEKPAKLVDHIVEIKDGGDMWDLDNLQSLCDSCHTIKTHEEQKKRDLASLKLSFSC